MNRPPEQPPPYGALIEAAREDAGLSRREAAKRAGISDSWWRYVAAGWQNGPITGTAKVVAAMARAVGVTPDQLETQGERPDAARILRREAAGAPGPLAPSPGTAALRAVPSATPASGIPPTIGFLIALLARYPDDKALGAEAVSLALSWYPDDEVIAAIGAQRRKDPSVVLEEIKEWLDIQEEHAGRRGNGSSAG